MNMPSTIDTVVSYVAKIEAELRDLNRVMKYIHNPENEFVSVSVRVKGDYDGAVVEVQREHILPILSSRLDHLNRKVEGIVNSFNPEEQANA